MNLFQQLLHWAFRGCVQAHRGAICLSDMGDGRPFTTVLTGAQSQAWLILLSIGYLRYLIQAVLLTGQRQYRMAVISVNPDGPPEFKKHPGIAGNYSRFAPAVVLAPESIWRQTEAVCRYTLCWVRTGPWKPARTTFAEQYRDSYGMKRRGHIVLADKACSGHGLRNGRKYKEIKTVIPCKSNEKMASVGHACPWCWP